MSAAGEAELPARERQLPPEIVEGSREHTIFMVIEDLRPVFKADGGDAELIAIMDDKVFVKMTGACVGCQLAAMTMHGIEARIATALGERVHVLPAELLKRFMREKTA